MNLSFGYNLNERNIDLVKKIMKSISPDGYIDHLVTDLRSWPLPAIGKEDIILVYGERAAHEIRQLADEEHYVIYLPHPDKLDTALGETKLRTSVKKQLTEFKELLELDNKQNKKPVHNTTKKDLNLNEELPLKLTASDVRELEKQQISQGIKHWEGLTRDGKTIRVTVDPEEGSADVNVTFTELYALMGLKEAFRVTELEIVYKPSVATQESSSI